jgi:hypothetical protein
MENPEQFATFKHSSTIMIEILNQISKVNNETQDITTDEDSKSKLINYLKMMEFYSFNNLNLMIASRADAPRILVEILKKIKNCKHQKSEKDNTFITG